MRRPALSSCWPWRPAPSASRAEEPPSVREVVRRAGAFAERFGQVLQGVVAREQYVQTIRPWMGQPARAAGGGAGDRDATPRVVAPARARSGHALATASRRRRRRRRAGGRPAGPPRGAVCRTRRRCEAPPARDHRRLRPLQPRARHPQHQRAHVSAARGAPDLRRALPFQRSRPHARGRRRRAAGRVPREGAAARGPRRPPARRRAAGGAGDRRGDAANSCGRRSSRAPAICGR